MSESQQLFGWYVTGVSGFVHGLLYNDEVCSDTEVSAAKIVLARAILESGQLPHQLLLTPTNLSNRARSIVGTLEPLRLSKQDASRFNTLVWIPFEDYLKRNSINYHAFSLAYANCGIPNAMKFLEYVIGRNSQLSLEVAYEAVCIAMMSVHVVHLLRIGRIQGAYDLIMKRSGSR